MRILLYLLLVLEPVCCSLNLFLSTMEMKKLLGLGNELYYVRDGTVNKYAMGFVIRVPSSVSSLHFSWSATQPTYYSITTSSSHPTALPSPPINITRTGQVPSEPQTWSLGLRCSGVEAAEVVITLDIAIRFSSGSNTTKLKFQRKKACFISPPEGISSTILEPMLTVEEGARVPAYVVFFSGVGSCLMLLVLVVTAVIAAWMRTTKSAKIGVPDTSNVTQYTPVPAGDTSGTMNNTADLLAGHTTGFNHQMNKVVNPHPVNYTTSTLRQSVPGRSLGDGLASDTGTEWAGARQDSRKTVVLEDLVIDRLDLTLGDLLLEGTFGRVYQGRLVTRPNGEEVTKDVMVKTIVMGSSQAQAVKLVTEGSLLYSVSHKHVVPLLATTTDGTSPMMIYEYMSPGNLKKWLTGCHQPVSTHQCVSLGLELLSALKHLHKRQIIHRDVAARNCYLTSSLSIKLCDPALSKDIFPNDYHCLGDNENRPVKWMAIESISSTGDFTASSDVWAWGVTMWEVLTRAQQPFPDVDPFEMETYLMEGFRLHQPLNCPDQLYTVMVSCWAHSPHHRASLQSLYSHLLEFSTQLQQFV